MASHILTPSQLSYRQLAHAFGEEPTPDMYTPPLTAEQIAALDRVRGLDRSFKLPSESYVEKQNKALQQNTARQESIKREIARQELELAQRVPGTILLSKRLLKQLKAELKEVKILRGCLYNGGVW